MIGLRSTSVKPPYLPSNADVNKYFTLREIVCIYDNCLIINEHRFNQPIAFVYEKIDKDLDIFLLYILTGKTMFVTDKIIYLQMHKTACTHVASLLSKHIGGKQIGKHNWLEDFQTDKFICGSIRNPWDWYISLWAFGCKGEGNLHRRVAAPDFLKFPEILKSKLMSTYGPYLSKNFQLRDMLFHFTNEMNKPTNLWRESYKDNQSPECFRMWLKLIYDPARMRDFDEGYSESSVSKFAGLMTYRYCNFFLKDFLKQKISRV